MARTVSARTPEEQATADRIAALRAGTPTALRAWAEHYAIPLINPDDDELLLISIHEARTNEPGIGAKEQAQSRRWLKENRARIIATREGRQDG